MDGGLALPPSKQQIIQALIEEGATPKSIIEKVKSSFQLQAQLQGL